MKWKQGTVFSLRLRNGKYSIIQMIKEPYIIVFDIFLESIPVEELELDSYDILFVKGILLNILKKSETQILKNYKPKINLDIPTKWLHKSTGFKQVKIWEGTDKEISLLVQGGESVSLVEKDITKDSKFLNKSGVYDKVLIKDIDKKEVQTINNHELTSLSTYPTFNERLLLCQKLDKNVDPEKEILFEREIPDEYESFINILNGTVQIKELGY